MGLKAVETTRNINALGPGTANERTEQWWLKVCTGDESLKMSSEAASRQRLTVTSWEQSSRLILLWHKKLPKNSASTILWAFRIGSKLARWRSSISGCLVDRPKMKRSHQFQESSSLILCNNNELFLNGIVTKGGFYVTAHDEQLSGWTMTLQSPSKS